jgi:hypothetical protein
MNKMYNNEQVQTYYDYVDEGSNHYLVCKELQEDSF